MSAWGQAVGRKPMGAVRDAWVGSMGADPDSAPGAEPSAIQAPGLLDRGSIESRARQPSSRRRLMEGR